MFKNCIAENSLVDYQLYKYVKEIFIDIVENTLEDVRDLSKDESVEEYLDHIFPRAFLQRNPQKAVQILYDLEDIAKSDVIRDILPPLHQYVMYRLIWCYLELREDLGKSPFDRKIEKYVRANYSGENRDFILSWFDDMLDDFVDQYDDEYIYEDIWEYTFLWEISHPNDAILVTKAKEEMLELMPNDVVYHWTELKEKQERLGIKASSLRSAIIDFKFFVEGSAYSAFSVTEHPREEIGRTLLQTYLTPRGFREAQMSGGNSDLVYPEF